MATNVNVIHELSERADNLAMVAVTRRDGSIHTSLVSAGVMADPVDGAPSIGMVVGGGTAKLRLLRQARRATVSFQAGFEWVAVEGRVRVVGPDDLDGTTPADGVPRVLRDVFTAAGGSHDDWAEYDRVMAAERRAAVFVRIDSTLSNG